MQKNKEVKFKKSSGNIFKDLGHKNPEESLAKAKIAMKINERISDKKYSQKKAAEILEIDQPRVSDLKNGRLRGFSIERLLHFLNALNYDVSISLKDREVEHSSFEVFTSI